MSVMASWNGKTWGVSPERIAALNGVSASVELDTENSDDKAGSPATKTKALKLQSMSFDFDLGVAVGCKAKGEMFLSGQTLGILAMGIVAFYLGTVGGLVVVTDIVGQSVVEFSRAHGRVVGQLGQFLSGCQGCDAQGHRSHKKQFFNNAH